MTTLTLNSAIAAARRAARLASVPAKPAAALPSPSAAIPATVSTILADWQQRWPALFDPAAPVPLAIGINKAMHAAGLSHSQLKRGLSVWCSRRAYLKALAQGDARFGLDGLPAGEVTEAQQARAKAKLNPPEQTAASLGPTHGANSAQLAPPF